MRSIFGVLVVVASACSSSSTTPSDASVSTDASVGAEATIGAAGGTVSHGGVTLDVPPGAVTEPTVFRIQPTSRAPRVSPGISAVSQVIRLEPARTFAKPIRVTLAVDASRVPSGSRGPNDGLLLMKAPTGTDDFVPVGAADPGATTLTASVESFSEIVAFFLQVIGCEPVALNACMQECDPMTGVCSGSCTLQADDVRLTASCSVQPGGNTLSCTCSSDDPTADRKN
jgi:hypothetical protein